MTKPQLLVDKPKGFVNGGALFARNLDVGEGKELKNLIFRPPDAA